MNQNNQFNNYDTNTANNMNQNNQFNNYDTNTANNMNQNNQFNNYDTNTANNMNQVSQINPVVGQSLNNEQVQVNNVSQSTVALNNNEEFDKAFNTLKKDFILLAIIHFISTIFGIFALEYNLFVLVLRIGIFAMFICGFISAKNKSSSAMTFATVSAIFLFITMGFVEVGLGVFLLIHSSKCSKVIKQK